MHDNIAKAHHVLEAIGQGSVDPVALGEQREYIAGTFQYAQTFASN